VAGLQSDLSRGGLEPVSECVRFFASWVVETDPIGILRNNLDDMKKAKYNLDQTLQRFAGSDERLQRSIAAKSDEINNLGHKAAKAEQMANAAGDPMEKERLCWSARPFLEQAGMLMQGVKQLQALEDQTSKMLKTFQHWSQIADSKIQRTENKVNFLAEQRKMILDAKATLGVGQQPAARQSGAVEDGRYGARLSRRRHLAHAGRDPRVLALYRQAADRRPDRIRRGGGRSGSQVCRVQSETADLRQQVNRRGP
jgi:hypothetical protein